MRAWIAHVQVGGTLGFEEWFFAAWTSKELDAAIMRRLHDHGLVLAFDSIDTYRDWDEATVYLWTPVGSTAIRGTPPQEDTGS